MNPIMNVAVTPQCCSPAAEAAFAELATLLVIVLGSEAAPHALAAVRRLAMANDGVALAILVEEVRKRGAAAMKIATLRRFQ